MKKVKPFIKTLLFYVRTGAIVYKCQISSNVIIRRKSRVYDTSVGRYTYITRGCLIQNTEIGQFCSISENCYIGMPSHPTHLISTSPVFLSGNNYFGKNFKNTEYSELSKTIIGDDIWIGVGVKIKSGIVIGSGAVLGSGAVVTHDVPPYAIVAGVPAKILHYRFEKESRDRLLQSEWWNWDESRLQGQEIDILARNLK